MHIVVFGSGGVGGYFGGRLAQAGEHVTFIARGAHLQAMRTNGLSVESIQADFTIHPVDVIDDSTSISDVDVVLVCVKTWQIDEAARAILPMLKPATAVVPLENGVEAPSQLAEVLGKEHVLGGLCRISSHIASPGHIQHTGIVPSVEFGELDNQPSLRSQALLEQFQRTGIEATVPADIHLSMWNKFLFISSTSGLGALTRVPVGYYRSLPGARKIMQDALNECYQVGIAMGIAFPADSVINTLAFIDSLPPNTVPSMQRDIMDGCPSELESQNGAIVHMGRRLGIPTPIHEFIYSTLLPQETQARKSHN
jgi:2-dehydropantoate 2-reductase